MAVDVAAGAVVMVTVGLGVTTVTVGAGAFGAAGGAKGCPFAGGLFDPCGLFDGGNKAAVRLPKPLDLAAGLGVGTGPDLTVTWGIGVALAVGGGTEDCKTGANSGVGEGFTVLSVPKSSSTNSSEAKFGEVGRLASAAPPVVTVVLFEFWAVLGVCWLKSRLAERCFRPDGLVATYPKIALAIKNSNIDPMPKGLSKLSAVLRSLCLALVACGSPRLLSSSSEDSK